MNSLRDVMKDSIGEYLEKIGLIVRVENYNEVRDLTDIVFNIMGISSEKQDESYKD